MAQEASQVMFYGTNGGVGGFEIYQQLEETGLSNWLGCRMETLAPAKSYVSHLGLNRRSSGSFYWGLDLKAQSCVLEARPHCQMT